MNRIFIASCVVLRLMLLSSTASAEVFSLSRERWIETTLGERRRQEPGQDFAPRGAGANTSTGGLRSAEVHRDYTEYFLVAALGTVALVCQQRDNIPAEAKPVCCTPVTVHISGHVTRNMGATQAGLTPNVRVDGDYCEDDFWCSCEPPNRLSGGTKSRWVTTDSFLSISPRAPPNPRILLQG